MTTKSKKRDVSPLLCWRWRQGPHWVLGNVVASTESSWAWHSPTHASEGSSIFEILDVQALVLRPLSWLPEPWFSHSRCGLGSPLEKFCQQNEAYCLPRECFYHSLDQISKEALLISGINEENGAFLTQSRNKIGNLSSNNKAQVSKCQLLFYGT